VQGAGCEGRRSARGGGGGGGTGGTVPCHREHDVRVRVLGEQQSHGSHHAVLALPPLQLAAAEDDVLAGEPLDQRRRHAGPAEGGIAVQGGGCAGRGRWVEDGGVDALLWGCAVDVVVPWCT
jgi:hypothetical protein